MSDTHALSLRLHINQVYTIGRSSKCDYVVNDARVSKLHCQVKCIWYDGRILFGIRDMGSGNGTKLLSVDEGITEEIVCDDLLTEFEAGDTIILAKEKKRRLDEYAWRYNEGIRIYIRDIETIFPTPVSSPDWGTQSD